MNHTWQWEPSKKEKIIFPVIKLEILSGIPQGYVLGPFSFPLQQWFSKCGTRASSSGTQRNLRIKYKSGRVSTKAIFF